MKLSHIASLLAGIGILAGVQVAHAADGTITISGEITDQTCTINGGLGGDIAVTLATVPASTFATAGSTAGWTSFDMVLTNCPGTQVRAAFTTGAAGIDVASGTLNNVATLTPASGVSVALRNVGAATNLHLPTAGQWLLLSGGNGTLKHEAGYYATAASVTAGLVSTDVVYSLEYQ